MSGGTVVELFGFNMGKYVAEQTVKQLIKAGKVVNKCRILVLGIVLKEYGIELFKDFESLKPFDGIVAAVKHRDFANLDLKYLKSLCSNPCILTDVKGIFNKENVLKTGFNYWRL